MAVFISYSSRDRALLERLLVALRRGREQVWFDEELTGGETWWRTILEQIRGCDVFLVALSKNMLDSKACQAELRYAQALGKPILPVQVGPLDNMRINPLAQMQVIDYREPSIETGIELVSSVHARKAMSPALPDPLPEEPPIPFAYLMRLASTISGPSLTAQEQLTLVAELKAGLEEDGDDLSARRDITQLLCMLRDRSDVTWRTRTEVESVLASLEKREAAEAAEVAGNSGVSGSAQTAETPVAPLTAPVYSGVPPAYSGPLPTYPPPGPQGYGLAATGPVVVTPPKPPKSNTKWLAIGGGIAGAILAAIVVVAVIALSGKGDKPAPPPVAKVDSTQLDSILLSADDIHSIAGRSDLTATDVVQKMDDTTVTISDPNCTGVVGTAMKSVYAESGYTYVRDQAFSLQDPHIWIAQTAVLFPSADQADAFLKKSGDRWTQCDGQTVTVAADNGSERWAIDSTTRSDSRLEQNATQEGQDGYACRHVVRAVSNVLIEAVACSKGVTDEADRIADKMAANIPS